MPTIQQRIALLLTVAVVAAAYALSDRTPVRDPLEVPAVASSLASQTQLIGITRAGKRLVAVGWRGHILVSDDAGRQWTQVPSPSGSDLTAVSFTSPTTGWAVGHGGVGLQTTDGGQSWVKRLDGFESARAMVAYYQKQVDAGSPTAAAALSAVQLNTKGGPEQPWLDVGFENAQHGYVVGTFNMIMETTDAGQSWLPRLEQVDNPDALHLNSITFVDGKCFIASERGTVFVLDKASRRFVPLRTGYTGTFFGVIGGRGSLIAYGLRGTAYRSVDDGRSWTALKTGVNTAITGGQVLPDGRLILVTQGGDLLLGSADASRFVALKVERPSLFSGVALAAPDTVATVGTAGVNLERLPANEP